MTRATKLCIAGFTFIAEIYVVLFVWSMVYMFSNFSGPTDQDSFLVRNPSLIKFYLYSGQVLIYSLLAFYIGYVLMSARIPNSEKLRWVSKLLIFWYITMPVFWYRHIWKDREEKEERL